MVILSLRQYIQLDYVIRCTATVHVMTKHNISNSSPWKYIPKEDGLNDKREAAFFQFKC